MPVAQLAANGSILTMGRSSNSSHFQLSSNRLISRVHVKARYIPSSDPSEPAKMEIICNGWNGLKLHCQGRTWELFKGDTFTAETEGKDVMVDVLDARVLVAWPKRSSSESSWDDSPSRRSVQGGSPMRRAQGIQSPISPTPGQLTSSQRLQALFPSPRSRDEIQIFEDEPELPEQPVAVDVGASMRTEATASFSSELSDEPESDGENHDEENDPVVHSFGPFGANLQASFAGISTKSPKARGSPKKMPRSPFRGHGARLGPSPKLGPSPRQLIPCEPLVKTEDPVKRSSSPAEAPTHDGLPKHEGNDNLEADKEATPTPIDPSITNHVINQLAFSRLSSTPLSTIMANLPADSKIGLSRESLRAAVESTPAIGIIERQGKDAAGKMLESEYYYVPEADGDEQRRAAVVDGLRKPSLRACRKQHKVSLIFFKAAFKRQTNESQQYYWKRPKTP